MSIQHSHARDQKSSLLAAISSLVEDIKVGTSTKIIKIQNRLKVSVRTEHIQGHHNLEVTETYVCERKQTKYPSLRVTETTFLMEQKSEIYDLEVRESSCTNTDTKWLFTIGKSLTKNGICQSKDI